MTEMRSTRSGKLLWYNAQCTQDPVCFESLTAHLPLGKIPANASELHLHSKDGNGRLMGVFKGPWLRN